MYMAVNLNNPGGFVKWGLIVGNTFYNGLYSTVSYGASWTFGTATTASVCSDSMGGNGVNCVIQNFKTSTIIPLQYVTMPFSNSGKLFEGPFFSNKDIFS